MKNKGIASGLAWKMLERFGVQGVQFILQIILARILDPEHYGTLSMMIIFSSLATVFVQTGFNTALVQNKDVTEEDYSSVFWITILVAAILYAISFAFAPMLANFYQMPDIVWPFRVLMLVLFPGSLNSIQLAKVSREMDFRKVFFSNIGAVLISGAVGIAMAYMGLGLWALVAQSVLNVLIASIVMMFTAKWKLQFVCNMERIKVLFSFGWKLLASGCLDILYQDLSTLAIGKKYSSDTLGFFNRGKQFPQFVVNGVNGALQSVMLPAMSAKQNHKEQVKNLMKTFIIVGAYLLFPVIAGMAGVAETLLELLLTEKWVPSTPYMQIYCIVFAFYPINSCNLQAMNAIGRSDLFLKLELIKQSYGIVSLIFVIVLFQTPISIAVVTAITAVVSFVVNAWPNKQLLGYSFTEQIQDFAPSLLMSLIMMMGVLLIGKLKLFLLGKLLLQVVVGVVIYAALSLILRPKAFKIVFAFLKKRSNS